MYLTTGDPLCANIVTIGASDARTTRIKPHFRSLNL